MGNFDRCLAIVLREEGGYFHHPDDPGEETNRGIIKRVYDRYRTNRGLPMRSVREIETHEVRDIYQRYYWGPLQADEMPPGVDLAVFDFGVNSGINRSAKYVQRIVGVTPDGLIGPVTLAKINETDPDELINRLKDDRLKFVHQIRHKKAFIKGWTRRIARVRKDSLAFSDAFSVNDASDPGATVVIDKVTVENLPKAHVNNGAPKQSMAKSKTAWWSVITTGAGAVAAFEQVGSTATAVNHSVGNINKATHGVTSLLDTLANAITNPLFIFSVLIMGGGIYLWNDRKRKMNDLES